MRDELVADDPKSEELLKPYIEGKDVKRWCVESRELHLIYTPKKRIDIAKYPAIARHLNSFKKRLEARATKQEWYELQQPQERYSQFFAGEKIIYPDITDQPRFSLDHGSFLATTCFCLAAQEEWLVALLNSSTIWWLIKKTTPAIRGGFHRLKSQYIKKLPIPEISSESKRLLSRLANQARLATEGRSKIVFAFSRRVLTDLAPGGITAKPPKTLSDWPQLDFNGFHAEVKKHFKTTIPFDERDAWQTRFDKDRSRVLELTDEIIRSERQINAEVYRLFELSPGEITLIESTVRG